MIASPARPQPPDAPTSRHIGRAVDPRVHLSGDLRRTTSRREADDRAPDEEHDMTIVGNDSRSPS
jgi:hypothetical protein